MPIRQCSFPPTLPEFRRIRRKIRRTRSGWPLVLEVPPGAFATAEAAWREPDSQNTRNTPPQLRENHFRVRRSIDRFESILDAEPVKLRKKHRLVVAKALVHIETGEKIHSRLPIVETAREDHARDQMLDPEAQMKTASGFKATR